jgi:hypothetical protein
MSEAAEMDLSQLHAMEKVLNDAWEERMRQHAKWGEQNHPDGTRNSEWIRIERDEAREFAEHLADKGELTFSALLTEEFYEAMCETDPAKLRVELIQVAALACQWVEAIDRRQGGTVPMTPKGER